MSKYFYLLFIIVLFSCNQDIKTDVKKTISSNVVYEDISFEINIKRQKLHSKAKEAVDNWQEYQSISEFIPKFYNTTTKEALFNSIQFYQLTSFLKDSTNIERFSTPSIKTRINVLNNEALRLFDMDSIPSITNKEIIHETNNIVNAFNALNIKINNAVKRDLLTKDLLEFNHLFEKDKDTFNIEPPKKLIKKQIKRKNHINLKKRIKRIKPLSKVK